jgi:hypothetical protein
MAIPPNADFNQLTTWLNENLDDKKRIKACCQEVHKVPETKGIYFWFIHPEGYNILGVKSIEPKYTRDIDGVKYDLVYLGTAGVRNNSNGINNGHLKERLKWHLCDNKNVSAICSGNSPTMSTYRRTIGGLISNDLIANNTQDKIDELLCKYFIIYYVEYPGAFMEVKDEVNKDEDILIDVMRPIFNLKKNSNAKNPAHITYEIQERRQVVENDSIKKWCNEKPKTKTKDMISKPKKQKTGNSTVSEYTNCVEFNVTRSQNIAIVVNGIPNLPVGPCFIQIFYKNRADVRRYVNGNTRQIRTTNRTVSAFFQATDKINGMDVQKCQIVYDEMNDPNKIIEEITVRVCPIN